MIKSFYRCGDFLWIRRNGKVLKRMFIEPYDDDYFVGQDEEGDNEMCSWNFIYGPADASSEYELIIGENVDECC